ncbi:MAG: molybdopterin-dependent oxidoreductase [Deltaproteobacteria bacterium]|nr:molybdopterin-dependent oxidoreductase [Deltaproteobacteria bacterium]
MVTLTIDGVKVTVKKGSSILEAAQQAGVRIPTLCHDKRLIPFGACRLCIVEVTARGRTRTMPACFNPARDGMEVATNTPKLRDSRRLQLMLLLRSHPLLCPSCDAGGDCQLQNLVFEYEVPELSFGRQSRYFHVDNDSNFIRFNMNLCIRCGMCVRVCEEVQGQSELSFVNRGIESEVSTDFDRALDCEFCGQCASICPVGAISSKWLVGTGRRFELQDTSTVCAFCSLGCSLTLGEKDGKTVYVTSSEDSVNEGNLCVKGRYGWPFAYSDSRLTKPLIRKDGLLVEASWDEAIQTVAEKFGAIKKSSGPDSLAALGSQRLTNEEAFVFNRLVRTVFGTNNLDHAGGYAYRSLTDGLAPMLGYAASTNQIREIRGAKAVLLLGADLTETHPIAKNEINLASVRKKAKVIVVDSIRTKLSYRDGFFLDVPPGYEDLVVNSMLKFIIDEGLLDRASVDLRVEGFEELAESLKDYTPEAIAAALGLDADLIKAAATAYAKAETGVIILSEGLNRYRDSSPLSKAAVNLALVTGHIGKESCGVYVFGEKANAQGALDMGLTPDLLPGYHLVRDEAARSKFEDLWKGQIPASPGMNARDILKGAENGSVKGLYVVGENPLDTYPNRQRVQNGLSKLEFLVVQDMFLSSTANIAHVVLPVAAPYEKAGTFTSSERRIQKLNPSSKQIQGKPDLEIFMSLAAKMGKPELSYAGYSEVMSEIAGAAPMYSGVSYERIGDKGLVWPCLDDEDSGTSTLYEGGFPIGKARLAPAKLLGMVSRSSGSLKLIPCVLKFHSGSFSEWSPSLMEVCPPGFAEMSRVDMTNLGLNDGDAIKIVGNNGQAINLKAKESRRALRGTVLVPYHFSKNKLNSFTDWGSTEIMIQVEKA